MKWIILMLLVSISFAALPGGSNASSRMHTILHCQFAYFGAGFPDGTPSLLNLSYSFCSEMNCTAEELAEIETMISTLEAHDAALSVRMQAGNQSLFQAATAKKDVRAASEMHETMVRKYFWFCYLKLNRYHPAFSAQRTSQKAYFNCLKTNQ